MKFTTDNNGFIRLNDNEFFKSRVKRFEKMFGINGTMSNWCPVETNPDYKKYPYKNFKGKYVDTYTACPAEVFCYRYFKKWIAMLKETNQNWIRFSYLDEYGGHNRLCKTLCVYYIEWVNALYRQIIRIKGFTLDGKSEALDIKIDNLHQIAIKVCSEAESNMLYAMLNNIKPEPNLPIFKIYKTYYSEHYDKYLEDCKIYGIAPLAKELIANVEQDIVINTSTSTVASENDDTYIVNLKFEK